MLYQLSYEATLGAFSSINGIINNYPNNNKSLLRSALLYDVTIILNLLNWTDEVQVQFLVVVFFFQYFSLLGCRHLSVKVLLLLAHCRLFFSVL